MRIWTGRASLINIVDFMHKWSNKRTNLFYLKQILPFKLIICECKIVHFIGNVFSIYKQSTNTGFLSHVIENCLSSSIFLSNIKSKKKKNSFFFEPTKVKQQISFLHLLLTLTMKRIGVWFIFFINRINKRINPNLIAWSMCYCIHSTPCSIIIT